jgi:hypothetical protein
MSIPAFPSVPVPGYTGLNLVGCQSMQTEVLAAQTLAADVTLTDAQARTIGLIEVTTGHASNAFIVPVASAVAGKMYFIVNNDATLAANIKVAGGSAITVAATKSALVYITSALAMKRLTADA